MVRIIFLSTLIHIRTAAVCDWPPSNTAFRCELAQQQHTLYHTSLDVFLLFCFSPHGINNNNKNIQLYSTESSVKLVFFCYLCPFVWIINVSSQLLCSLMLVTSFAPPAARRILTHTHPAYFSLSEFFPEEVRPAIDFKVSFFSERLCVRVFYSFRDYIYLMSMCAYERTCKEKTNQVKK